MKLSKYTMGWPPSRYHDCKDLTLRFPLSLRRSLSRYDNNTDNSCIGVYSKTFVKEKVIIK